MIGQSAIDVMERAEKNVINVVEPEDMMMTDTPTGADMQRWKMSDGVSVPVITI